MLGRHPVHVHRNVPVHKICQVAIQLRPEINDAVAALVARCPQSHTLQTTETKESLR